MSKAKFVKAWNVNLFKSFFKNQNLVDVEFQRMRSSSTADAKKHRNRAGVRRKTIFVQGSLDNCKNKEKERSSEWKRGGSIFSS